MKSMLISVVCFLFFPFNALSQDPDLLVGQKANYKLDKNPKRTTSLLTDGKFLATIKKYHPDAEGGPAMEVDLDYQFNVQFMGEQKGVESSLVDHKYFTEDFLNELRKNGKYESENFKAVHQGYKDVKTLQGKFYAHCDIILLYDLKDTANMPLKSDLSKFLATIVRTDIQADIQNMKILMHVYPGVPVLSAVQLDISGKYDGMAVKDGADFVAP
jgi:hypothetical protein